jgi:hypothetical protein
MFINIIYTLQYEDTKLSQCNFTIHLSKQTNCIHWYKLHSVRLGYASYSSAW